MRRFGLGLFCSLIWLFSAHASEFQFPLKAAQGTRTLVDQKDRPFLYNADTAWMLFLKLTLEEAEEYIATRKAQQFNAIQVILTGFQGMTNRAGASPFLNNNDFAQPNEAYFRHVDEVVRIAEKHNMLLSIAPLWAGCCGEGWAGREKDGSPKPMNANGPAKNHAFGKWLGSRYGRFQNIIWIIGGDNDPHQSRDVMRELALGLKEASPKQVLTYHAASSHSSTDVWPDAQWIDASMVYTYFRGFNKAWNKNQPDVYEVSYKEYNKTPVRPFFLGESTYEGEHDDWGSPLQARKQAYWAVLSGATGHAYGSPNWRCEPGWREGLQRPGALSLRHFYRLLTSRPWWMLVPDQKNEVAVEGQGPFGQNNYATTAVASDQSFAITYMPSPRTITMDLTRISGHELKTWWFNPRDGKAMPISHVARESRRSFVPPGEGDWVLVIEDAAKKFKDLAEIQ